MSGRSSRSLKADRSREGGYVARTWKRFKRDRFAMVGLILVVLLFLVSFLSPLLATNQPLVLELDGRTYFPAVLDLVDRYLPGTQEYSELRNVDYKMLLSSGRPSMKAWLAPIPYDPSQDYDLSESLKAPSWCWWVPEANRASEFPAPHWLGTDDIGRDVLSRMVHGSTISLKIGFWAMGIALAIGLVLGALAGYFGDSDLRIRGVALPIDTLISRFIEVMVCFPTMFLILAVIAFLEPNIRNIFIAIGLTSWTPIARYVRAEFLRIKTLDYTQAAVALGATDLRIIFRHILPNSLAPVLVTASFGVATAILTEAGLSFLGFGVQPPTPSWGGLLSLAKEYSEIAWWLAVFPGFAIFATVTAYNLLGDGLRDAIDPKVVEKK